MATITFLPLLLASALPAAPDLVLDEDLGLRLARGFRVTLFADHDLAPDVYAMTLDARGRPVITSAGWVKTLEDTDRDGDADRATLFATTASGGMGLAFDGEYLYFAGDGAFSRWRDADGDGRADGPPEKIFSLRGGEHGGHAMRKGPDGSWYVLGGNDAGIGAKHVSSARSPVREPEAGALLRVSADLREVEVVAHGFRNPYDFDLSWSGDFFTYDSDVESDFGLPWYTPTRIYHVAHGGHHGWRLQGYKRSWNRPGWYADVVDVLAPVGRGSPTGVATYRHTLFPERYRDGVFALDWTFGKVYFFRPESRGATLSAELEVFLEPVGTHGFAPTDAAVAPDGALYISIGGRKTRGGVYRIVPAMPAGAEPGGGSGAAAAMPAKLDQVLDAPQPLDVWSRARWLPVAKELGPAPFAGLLVDESASARRRVRAVEVLTEVFGGLPREAAEATANARPPEVRARAAWSLGRKPGAGDETARLLARFAEDPHPLVRRSALEALLDHAAALAPDVLARAARASLGSEDKRVRQAAARLAAHLPAASWSGLAAETAGAPARAKLTLALAASWSREGVAPRETLLDPAIAALRESRDAGERLDAVRLIQLALGDWRLENPAVEVHSAYEPALVANDLAPHRDRILEAARAAFPSGDALLDAETARLLAFVAADEEEVNRRVVEKVTPESTATSDFHYLAVLSRLQSERSPDVTTRTAAALLALDRKLGVDEERIKQNWSARLAELAGELAERDPALGAALLAQPDLGRAAHAPIVAAFAGEERQEAAGRFLAAFRKDTRYPLSPSLLDLLAERSPAELQPVLRSRWGDLALRDAILIQLARAPDPRDREKFIAGLESPRPESARAALAALETLPRDTPQATALPGSPAAAALAPAVGLLLRLFSEPKEAELRARAAAFIAREAGLDLAVKESPGDAASPAALKRAYRPLLEPLAALDPGLAAALAGGSDDDPKRWAEVLASVSWDEGNAQRGEATFRARCAACHTGFTALGPDLAGAAARFAREDLFRAIIFPNEDVAPAYRTTIFETRGGEVHVATVAYESAEGVILQTGAATTVRLAASEIASRRPGASTLMPTNLLTGLKPGEIADLDAYLRSLGKR